MILKGVQNAGRPASEPGTVHRARRIPMTDLNEHLTCTLCRGYFIDATTVIECLHSFCRSCIVKYLETNKYCPVCDVQVHKTKPLLNIRPDKTLQDIVYKLVPKLFQNEMQRRRQYYADHPDTKPSGLEQRGEASYQHLLSPDETICLSFNYHGNSSTQRYLRCQAAVSISHLQKLIRAKYDLTDNHRVDVLHNQDCLNSYLTLMDVAYIYLWRRKGPLELTYRIYENTAKRIKLEDAKEECTGAINNNNNDWKEVQLRISENGEMSVTGIQDCMDLLDEHCATSPDVKPTVEEPEIPKKEPPALKPIKPTEPPPVTFEKPPESKVCDLKPKDSEEKPKDCDVKPKDLSDTKQESFEVKFEEKVVKEQKSEVKVNLCVATTSSAPTSTVTKTTTINVLKIDILESKRKLSDLTKSDGEPQPKQLKPTPTVLNHSLGLQNLSNNHPLKKHSQALNKLDSKLKPPEIKEEKKVEKDVTITRPASTSLNRSLMQNSRPGTPQKWSKATTPGPPPCYVPKTTYNPVINVPKVQPSTSTPPKIIDPQISTTQSSMITNNKAILKTKSNSPMGYKTLRDPPKTWNPQISLSNMPKPKLKIGETNNIRPAKFFKMRNNLPRYLGNPASGVKPMYSVHVSPEKDKAPEKSEVKKPEKSETRKAEKSSEIRKHSIVKIDPKTLKPVSERAPEVSSLSTQSDLKINTSSVPIFNPLKLQCSPKGDRKSPLSPKKSASPPSKRDKLNLNYTPPNPFIPNLAAPTINPNQFLYPSGPPGFPAYDPRFVAAYHSFLYGPRLPFAPGMNPNLNMDMNRKNFEMPPTTTHSPKLQSPNSTKVSSASMTKSQHPSSPNPYSPGSPKPCSPKPAKVHRTSSPTVQNDKTVKANSVGQVDAQPPGSTKTTAKPNNLKAAANQVQKTTKSSNCNEKTNQPDNSSVPQASTQVTKPSRVGTLATSKAPSGGRKESSKGEKSLQNALEKLTQNKIKESAKSELKEKVEKDVVKSEVKKKDEKSPDVTKIESECEKTAASVSKPGSCAEPEPPRPEVPTETGKGGGENLNRTVVKVNDGSSGSNKMDGISTE